jgi:UDP-2,3-diacylglucosamine pyrophosphatase LpxH
MSQLGAGPILRFRSVFISDVHLGFRGCSADFLLDFLNSMHTETLYLVGDIIDLWSLEKSFFWPQRHNDVIRAILNIAQRGTRVIYIPGNHDRLFRDFAGSSFGNIEIRHEAVHQTADGKQLLVLHGDEFDAAIKASPWLAGLGSAAYTFTLILNHGLNRLRQLVGCNYWSLAAFLKLKVKNAARYIANFERALALEAKRRGVDGVICGHIHRAHIATIGSVLYCNDGDWVESCTTLTEDATGRLSLLRWTETRQLLHRSPQPSGEALDPSLDQAA